MRQHIRKLAVRRGEGQHPGLILSRFLAKHDKEGADRRDVLHAACGMGREPSLIALYRRAFERWNADCGDTKVEVDLLTPPHTRLIVGLGNKGVIEAGLRLHHTYGVPIIPGTALKGLASHYCAEVWGKADSRYGRPTVNFDRSKDTNYHGLLFGSTLDGGVVRFEDAWMHPNSLSAQGQGLLPDVMTPHHQQWQTEENAAPTDFDSPVPVPFLSVAGLFHFIVRWQGPAHHDARAWTKRAMDILQAALADWGAGGKTSSGYGRLIEMQSGQAVPGQPSGQAIQPPPDIPLPPIVKRDHGTPATVTILASRAVGFDVQETNRAPGVLNQGIAPATLPEIGASIEVYVFNDDPRKPQYRWDRPKPAAPPRPGGRGGPPRKR